MLKIASDYMGQAKLCTEENEQPILIARYFFTDYPADGRGFAESSCWTIHRRISFPSSDPIRVQKTQKAEGRGGKSQGYTENLMPGLSFRVFSLP